MKWLNCLTLLLFMFMTIDAQVFDWQPQQVHIAFGENIRDIVVVWSTTNETKESIVKYFLDDKEFEAKGYSSIFVDGGKQKHKQYIHTVRLSNLRPDSRYKYHCGSNLGWSDQFWFMTPPIDELNWQPHLAIFGDMGNENAQSLGPLQQETQNNVYDAIIHVGDFAYDMDSENAAVGDQYMRQIEPIAAYVPYMVCVGNHEERYNFSNYRNRLKMPGNTESLFYSFNMGPVHFIAFSTELYYFFNYGLKQLANQYDWLVNDLREANKPENRKVRPFIVTFAHRPMYCSNDDDLACKDMTTFVRTGIPISHLYGLEELFLDNGVDITIWAHQHSYERLWPIYDFQVKNGSVNEPYRNAKAPVHIITGSAGCKEDHAQFKKEKPEWSAFRSMDYGYTRMKAFNKTHLRFEQVSVEQNGQVIDSFWIVKDKPVPSYANPNVIN